MELEEMKELWTSMSQRIDKLEMINDQKVMEITKIKYKNKFSTLTRYETIGAVFCYIIAFFVVINFYKLDTWYLMTCGIISVAFLTIMPYYSLGYLKKLTNIDLSNSSYKSVLEQFNTIRRKTLNFQKSALVSSLLMMITSIPVADMILNNEDFFLKSQNLRVWIVIGVSSILLSFVAQWGLGWYKKITNSAEMVLYELDQE